MKMNNCYSIKLFYSSQRRETKGS